jgi:hypothetical protein
MALVCLILSSNEAAALDHVHTLSPAYHTAIIGSESSSPYNFHSPGVSYGVTLGRRFGFAGRLTAFFPVHLFQDGHYFRARDYYAPSIGGEMLLGAAYKMPLPDDQLMVADLGVSGNAIKLGSDIYETFYSFTLGLGACIAYHYPLTRVLTIGSFVNVAAHFVDLIHDRGGLRWGVFVSAGLTLGLRFGQTRSATS